MSLTDDDHVSSRHYLQDAGQRRGGGRLIPANPIAFGPLLQVAGDANIVFGGDYPHAGEPTLVATVNGRKELGLGTVRLEGIVSGNARSRFPGLLCDA